MQDTQLTQKIHLGDNLELLKKIPDSSVQLIYIDPPFNTGHVQKRHRIKVTQYDQGDRIGFGDKKYIVKEEQDSPEYSDSFSDYIGFLRVRLLEAHRILAHNGSLFFHIDWRESSRCRLMLDEVFGDYKCCINELIWTYDFGGRSKQKWSSKHDNIYWYAKDPKNYTFNFDDMDRIPYLSPGLVGEEKALRGKTPTDVWWQTIVPTNGKEKTGFPTQKPVAILNRIIKIHSNPGDVVLDFFAGSGTAGEAAMKHGRGFVMIDENEDAVSIMEKRLETLRS